MEVGIVAVAHHQLVAVSIGDSAVGGGISLAESQHPIGTVPGQIVNLDQLSRVLELRFAVALTLEVADFSRDWRHLSRHGQTVDLAELLKHLQCHAASFPGRLSCIPLRVAQQILSVVLADPAVLEVEHDFLPHPIGGGQRAGIERDADASRLVLDVHHLVEVARVVVGTDPAMDDDVFLDGVAEVAPVLPILGLQLGDGCVGRVRCAWHDHGRIVEVLLAARGHCHQQQHAQIEVKSLGCHIYFRFIYYRKKCS